MSAVQRTPTPERVIRKEVTDLKKHILTFGPTDFTIQCGNGSIGLHYDIWARHAVWPRRRSPKGCRLSDKPETPLKPDRLNLEAYSHSYSSSKDGLHEITLALIARCYGLHMDENGKLLRKALCRGDFPFPTHSHRLMWYLTFLECNRLAYHLYNSKSVSKYARKNRDTFKESLVQRFDLASLGPLIRYYPLLAHELVVDFTKAAKTAARESKKAAKAAEEAQKASEHASRDREEILMAVTPRDSEDDMDTE